MWDEFSAGEQRNGNSYRIQIMLHAYVLFRQKQERASHLFFLFLFWMQLFLARCHPFSFLFSSILPFFLPSLRFIQFHLTILTHTCSYNWTRTWCTITGLSKFIQQQMFLLYTLLSPSLSFSWTVYSWSILFRQTAEMLVYQIYLVVCSL